MLLIKNPRKTFILYGIILFVLITIYYLKIITPNELEIKYLLGKYLSKRTTYILLTNAPIIVLFAFVIYQIILYFCTIKSTNYTATHLQVNTKRTHNLEWSQIGQVTFVEKENKEIIRIVLKCKNNTFAIQHPDANCISSIKSHLSLDEVDHRKWENGRQHKRTTYILKKR